MRIRGTVVAGFAAFKDHLSYLPFSGSVDRPRPTEVVKKLIAVRLEALR